MANQFLRRRNYDDVLEKFGTAGRLAQARKIYAGFSP
jgi:hypothetical protein